jgi:hypothetical protein
MSVKILWKATVYNQVLDNVLYNDFTSLFCEEAIAILKEFDLDAKFNKALLFQTRYVPYDILGKHINFCIINSVKHFSEEKDFQEQLLNFISSYVTLFNEEKVKLLLACKLYCVRQLKVIDLVSEKLMNDLVDDRIDAFEELFKILDIKLKCPDDWNN